MIPSKHLGGKRSVSMSGNDSQQDPSATEVPPVYKKTKTTRHSGAKILAGGQSDIDENSAEYTGVPPELTSAAEDEGINMTDVDSLVKKLVMRPSDFVNVPDWDQIVGNDQAKSSLSATIGRKGFEDVYVQSDSILLFGPPGTGKTSMIKSLARRVGFACIEVTSDVIKKKYFGESETMVANIFSYAQAVAPCLICIDEVEEMLASNTDPQIGAEEGISIQFLKHMSAVKDSGHSVWVVAATSRPWNLSPAMRRRFTSRIYVPLPEKKDVLKLLKSRLKGLERTKSLSGRNRFELEKGVLGQDLDVMTTTYFKKPRKQYLSGDDVVQSVETIRRVLLEELEQADARFFKEERISGMQHIVPCKDNTEGGAFEKPLSTFSVEEARMLRFRPIGIPDVRNVLDCIGTTTTAEDIKAFDDWYNDFGTSIKKKKEDKQPNQSHSLRGNEKADLDLRDCLRGFRGHTRADLSRFLYEGMLD